MVTKVSVSFGKIQTLYKYSTKCFTGVRIVSQAGIFRVSVHTSDAHSHMFVLLCIIKN